MMISASHDNAVCLKISEPCCQGIAEGTQLQSLVLSSSSSVVEHLDRDASVDHNASHGHSATDDITTKSKRCHGATVQ